MFIKFSLFILKMQEKYGKSQQELLELCSTLSDFIDVNNDGQVTYEEWCNWIQSKEQSKSDTEIFFGDHPEYLAWKKLFFELSKGKMKIELDNFCKHIADTEDTEVKFSFNCFYSFILFFCSIGFFWDIWVSQGFFGIL